MVTGAWQQDSAPHPHPQTNAGRTEHSHRVCSRMLEEHLSLSGVISSTQGRGSSFLNPLLLSPSSGQHLPPWHRAERCSAGRSAGLALEGRGAAGGHFCHSTEHREQDGRWLHDVGLFARDTKRGGGPPRCRVPRWSRSSDI